MAGKTTTDKTLELLIETERKADQVLQTKQEIIALDKRRQAIREAIREIGKSDQPKVWITIGSMLVKLERNKGLELMKKDQQTIDIEINKLQSNQKVYVGELRDLEYGTPLKGFDLKPLDHNEMSSIKSVLPRL